MRVFIIAEVGINHNGDMRITKELITAAKKCGADAVKFQKRDINIVYSKELLSQKRESPWGSTQLDQKKGLEFGKEEYDEINKFCKDLDIVWFASAWDLNSVKFLEQFNFKYPEVTPDVPLASKLGTEPVDIKFNLSTVTLSSCI